MKYIRDKKDLPNQLPSLPFSLALNSFAGLQAPQQQQKQQHLFNDEISWYGSQRDWDIFMRRWSAGRSDVPSGEHERWRGWSRAAGIVCSWMWSILVWRTRSRT